MSHIVIIVDRKPAPTTDAVTEAGASECTATVTYVVPHDATDAEVGQAVKKLVKQVRDLGS